MDRKQIVQQDLILYRAAAPWATEGSPRGLTPRLLLWGRVPCCLSRALSQNPPPPPQVISQQISTQLKQPKLHSGAGSGITEVCVCVFCLFSFFTVTPPPAPHSHPQRFQAFAAKAFLRTELISAIPPFLPQDKSLNFVYRANSASRSAARRV